MDTLTFTVEMAKALAWPIIVLVGIFTLRKPLLALLDLIPFLEEFKYKEYSLRFHRKITEAEEQVKMDKTTEVLPPPTTAAEQDALLRVARLSPRAAVMEAWLYLESSLLDISVAQRQIESKGGYSGNSRIGHAMLELKAFDKTDFKLFHDLLKLRNDAAHVPDFALSPSDAEGYVSLAMGLVNRAKNRVVNT